MAYEVPYTRTTYRVTDQLIPGNSKDPNPVEFDLAPAEGTDLARLKSIVVGLAGLIQDANWSPAVQDMVIKAFETGAPAFKQTVEAIRGLTVPAGMALRCGLISELPKTSGVVDRTAKIPIVTGPQFSQVCGFLGPMAMYVAAEIVKLTSGTMVDPRFFVQPSGSGGPKKASRRNSSAKRATKGHAGTGTAGDPSAPNPDPPAGT